jgi:cytochrome c oxidase subunit 4
MHLAEQRGSNALVPLTAVVFVVVLLVLVVIETNQRFKPTIPPGPFEETPSPAGRGPG